MPLDSVGRTRATLNGPTVYHGLSERRKLTLNPIRSRNWGLKLFPMNMEYLVSVSHHLALDMSLPLVHTARRYC